MLLRHKDKASQARENLNASSSQLSPCGQLFITGTWLLETAAKSLPKKITDGWLTYSRYYGLSVSRVPSIKGVAWLVCGLWLGRVLIFYLLRLVMIQLLMIQFVNDFLTFKVKLRDRFQRKQNKTLRIKSAVLTDSLPIFDVNSSSGFPTSSIIRVNWSLFS